jgi:hypothetical protein
METPIYGSLDVSSRSKVNVKLDVPSILTFYPYLKDD